MCPAHAREQGCSVTWTEWGHGSIGKQEIRKIMRGLVGQDTNFSSYSWRVWPEEWSALYAVSSQVHCGCSETPCKPIDIIQALVAWTRDGSPGGDGTWLEFGYNFKAEPKGFANPLDVESEENRDGHEPIVSSRSLLWATCPSEIACIRMEKNKEGTS